MIENFEVSTKEFFNILSKGIVDQGHRKSAARHINIKEYELELDSNFPDKIKELRSSANSVKSDVCVVYTVWDNFEYVKYAYLSILSNYLCTDLERFDLKIIISGEIAKFGNYLKPFFESLGADVLIDKGLKFKYVIPQVYSNYEAVFNVDADMFFLGGHTELYSKLFRRYKTMESDSFFKTPYLVYGEDKLSPTKRRFHLPMRVAGPNKFGMEDLDKDKFMDYWVDEVEFLDLTKKDLMINFNDEWIWNIFSLFTPDLFNTTKFDKLCSLARELEIWDDEFIYTLYFWDKKIPTIYLKNFNDLNFIKKGRTPESVPDDKVSIVHPTNEHNPETKKIFKSIENDFLKL